jgi:hypothetical protein
MVEPLDTVTSPNMQVSPLGITRIGESPTEQGTPRLVHIPSSQRNCLPAWQLADPVEKVMPAKSQVRELTIAGSAPQACVVDSHSPSSQRNSRPLWHDVPPSEYFVPLW